MAATDAARTKVDGTKERRHGERQEAPWGRECWWLRQSRDKCLVGESFGQMSGRSRLFCSSPPPL